MAELMDGAPDLSAGLLDSPLWEVARFIEGAQRLADLVAWEQEMRGHLAEIDRACIELEPSVPDDLQEQRAVLRRFLGGRSWIGRSLRDLITTSGPARIDTRRTFWHDNRLRPLPDDDLQYIAQAWLTGGPLNLDLPTSE